MADDVTTMWLRSSFCADGACVEVAKRGDLIAMRDGKNPLQPAIELSLDDWRLFIDGIARGELSSI